MQFCYISKTCNGGFRLPSATIEEISSISNGEAMKSVSEVHSKLLSLGVISSRLSVSFSCGSMASIDSRVGASASSFPG